MAVKNITVTICMRHDTSANWQSKNPILGKGEFGYDDTKKIIKIGDGVSAWNSLPDNIGAGNSNFSGSYTDLTNTPTTLSGYGITDAFDGKYDSLTGRPTIPTKLSELNEKKYSDLTDVPTIPTNSSFTLAGLSEKSYNSLTDKPTIPTAADFTNLQTQINNMLNGTTVFTKIKTKELDLVD